ncbi:MAG: regulatory protein RecX [Lachnospiraceae bacterium]|nr:regulatory protein RecX [Lachnospiraceae bacterium]
MIVTRLEQGNGKKYRVYADEEFLFALYVNELRQFHIQEGREISSDVIAYILDTIIYKRAKERALFLLEKRPYSVHMLKRKLKDNEYPVNVIDKVMTFLEKYHYLDDKEYVRMYVESYSGQKSKKQLVYDLYRKGISKAIVEEFFEVNDYSEQNCFEKQFQRYVRGKNPHDYRDRQKIFRYFYNKGFSTALIERYIKEELLQV